MSKDIWEAIFSLKLLEKKISRALKGIKNEEKNLYRKLVNAVINNDRGIARDYARQIIRLKKKRRELERYLSKVKMTRIDLESAAITKDIHTALRSTVKAIVKLGKMIHTENIISDLERMKDVLNEIGILSEEIEEPITIREEEEIEELINKAELTAEEEISRELPEIPDEEIEKEAEEIEHEEE